ncbi:hypothetical protein CC80DRAFT_502938 [Byssothecium circinans]|uniref:Uncharacterized protein n=1 Tax=Byssothecium circinans TaxID=147558 RepID=A0A6A5U2G1_9PLEO|nr:hypothetical protein CC80DRAFT_502938 [Byssothecium circinans]
MLIVCDTNTIVLSYITPWNFPVPDRLVTSTGGFEVLCSYSWKYAPFPSNTYINTSTPTFTILVPGCPTKWAPPAVPAWLPPNNNMAWVDQHAYRVPVHQFEPTFQAMMVMNPNIRLNDTNIIINRNSLMHLMDFASLTMKLGSQFRVDPSLVKNTLVVGGKAPNASVQPVRSGYRRSFEECGGFAERGR